MTQEVRTMIRVLFSTVAAVAILCANATDAKAFGKRGCGTRGSSGCSAGVGCGTTASFGGCSTSGGCNTGFGFGVFQRGQQCTGNSCTVAGYQNYGSYYAAQPVQPGTTITGNTVIVDGQVRPVASQTQTQTTMPETITINGVTYIRQK